MKKTNVMIEVSDSLYENVVLPYKKRKSFGKLVIQLLEAYAENDAIYSYINGAIDGMEEEITGELLKELNNMSDSLSMMGMLGNQAEAVIDNGKRDFEDIRNSGRQEVNTGAEGGDHGVSKEEVVSMFNDFSNNMASTLKDIIAEEMKKVSSQGSQVVREVIREVPVKIEPRVVHEYADAPVITKPVRVEPDRVEPAKVEEPVVKNETKFAKPEEVSYIGSNRIPSEEDKSKAKSALGSLIGSIGSF